MPRPLHGVRVRAAAALACALLARPVAALGSAEVPHSARQGWWALLHYGGEEGRWVSEVDDASFFLDDEGRTRPEREWEADRLAFLTPPRGREAAPHAQCRFPARFALMRDALRWSEGDYPRVACPDLEAHVRDLAATSVSVVFVSHHLDNPASAFGHAMLYLDSNGARGATLSDYSVSFEADTEGMAPAAYLPRGLFGGLNAGYRVAPLHERVRKYERQEHRDLWLFPLRLTPEEVDRLVLHLWELEGLTFRYGFFGGNCAQKLLALVHAIAPGYGVLPYARPAVLPQEVARRLVDRIGLAGDPVRRPSIASDYTSRVARLTSAERARLEDLEASRTIPEGTSAATLSVALLRTEIEAPARAFRREADAEDHADFVWRRALWEARVRGGDTIDERRPPPSIGPTLLQAHRPSSVSLRAGYRTREGSVLAGGARWLLHDALDPPAGYPPLSSVEVARVDIGMSGAGRVVVEEVTALRVEKLGPSSPLESALAWKIDVGVRRLAYGADTPLVIGAELGVGAGASTFHSGFAMTVYAMAGARPGVALEEGGATFVPAGVVSGGLLLGLPADVRARVSGEYALSLRSLETGAAAVRATIRKGLTRDWDVELSVNRSPGRSGLSLGLVSFR